MEDLSEDIKNLRVRLDEASRYLRIPELLERREQLEEEMADPDLWDDQNRGREVQKNLSETAEDIDLHQVLESEVEDLETLYELATEEGDESLDEEIRTGLQKIQTKFDRSL